MAQDKKQDGAAGGKSASDKKRGPGSGGAAKKSDIGNMDAKASITNSGPKSSSADDGTADEANALRDTVEAWRAVLDAKKTAGADKTTPRARLVAVKDALTTIEDERPQDGMARELYDHTSPALDLVINDLSGVVAASHWDVSRGGGQSYLDTSEANVTFTDAANAVEHIGKINDILNGTHVDDTKKTIFVTGPWATGDTGPGVIEVPVVPDALRPKLVSALNGLLDSYRSALCALRETIFEAFAEINKTLDSDADAAVNAVKDTKLQKYLRDSYITSARRQNLDADAVTPARRIQQRRAAWQNYFQGIDKAKTLPALPPTTDDDKARSGIAMAKGYAENNRFDRAYEILSGLDGLNVSDATRAALTAARAYVARLARSEVNA